MIKVEIRRGGTMSRSGVVTTTALMSAMRVTSKRLASLVDLINSATGHATAWNDVGSIQLAHACQSYGVETVSNSSGGVRHPRRPGAPRGASSAL